MTNTSALLRNQYLSDFSTTYKNQMLRWALSLAIIPAYVGSIYLVFSGILDLVDRLRNASPGLVLAVHIVVASLGILALSPLVLRSFTRRYWFGNVRAHSKLAFTSLWINILLLQVYRSSDLIFVLQLAFAAAYLSGFFAYLTSNRYWTAGIFGVFISALIFGMMGQFSTEIFSGIDTALNRELPDFSLPDTLFRPNLSLGPNPSTTSQLSFNVQQQLQKSPVPGTLLHPIKISTITILALFPPLSLILLTVVSLIWSWFITFTVNVRMGGAVTKYSNKNRWDFLRHWLGMAIVFSVPLVWLLLIARFHIDSDAAHSSATSMFFGIGSLGALIWSSDQYLLRSNLRAQIRQLLTLFRHERIRYSVSPTNPPTNILNRIGRFLYQLRLLENLPSLLLIMMAIVFFIIIYRDSASSVLGILGLALLLFSLLFFMFLFQLRQRYIVVPFETSSSDVFGISESIKQQFVTQMQYIGALLSLNQIENARTETNLSYFISNRLDADFLQEVQGLTTLQDSSNPTLSWFTRFVAAIVRTFAVIRVSGWVEFKKDEGINIRIDFSRRGRNTISVSYMDPTWTSSTTPDEQTILQIARQLAVDLVLKLGHSSHIASSNTSMHHFLAGLEATKQRNWWRAAEEYRAVIQLEEGVREGYGIGYYHLGSVMLAQGELELGLQNLEQAELSGPPLAETQYLLALAMTYLYWDQLHRRHKDFKLIERRLKTALRYRRDFPESHHLLGTLYYQRAKLIQRFETAQYPEHEELYPVGHRYIFNYKESYRLAERHFRLAARAYSRAINRLLSRQGLNNATQAEFERLVQERLTVLHRLADALRSQGKFAEADSYYFDVLAALPNNVRTMVDIAKTYCMGFGWQRAQEFLEHYVRSMPEAQWHSDSAFYVGWMLAGGVLERTARRPVWWMINPLIRSRLSHIDDLGVKSALFWTLIIGFFLAWSGTLAASLVLFNIGLFLSLVACSISILYLPLNNSFARLLFALQLLIIDSSLIMAWIVVVILVTLRVGVYRLQRNGTRVANRTEVEQHEAELLGKSVSFLDFALHQRPQYMARWYQNDWQRDFVRAANHLNNRWSSKLVKDIANSHSPTIYQMQINNRNIHYIDHLRLWLAWRLDSRNFNNAQDSLLMSIEQSRAPLESSDDVYKEIAEILEKYSDSLKHFEIPLRIWVAWRNDNDDYNDALGQESGRRVPLDGLDGVYKEIKVIHAKYSDLLKSLDRTGRLQGMTHAYRRMEIALRAKTIWYQAYTIFAELLAQGAEITTITNHEGGITFQERWVVDVVAEAALLASMLLTEAWMYEDAYLIARDTSVNLQKWRVERWDKVYKGKLFLFSPRVFRYQQATLYSYAAYCAIQLCEHAETSARVKNWESSIRQKEIGKLTPEYIEREYIKKANDYMPRHPLALLSNALVYRMKEQPESAITEIQRLISVIAPFDPGTQIANWRVKFRKSDHRDDYRDPDYKLELETPDHKSKSLYDRMKEQHIVSGELQFSHIVNLANIYLLMSQLYMESSKPTLGVTHLMNAIALSEYRDIDADNLIQLTFHLLSLDRHADASAIINAVRLQRFVIEGLTFSALKRYEPDLLDIMIATRQGKFESALSAGIKLYAQLEEQIGYWKSAEDLRTHYQERLELLMAADEKDREIQPPSSKVKDSLIKVLENGIQRISSQEGGKILLCFAHMWFDEDRFAALLADRKFALDKYLKSLSVTGCKVSEERLNKVLDSDQASYLTYRMVEFLSREAVRLLELRSLLYNNVAYNMIELNIRAIEQADVSASGQAEGLSPEVLVDRALEIMRELHTYSMKRPEPSGRNYSRYMAEFYDTKGWLYYRNYLQETVGSNKVDSDKSKLIWAKETLETALKYYQESPIVYYHLARVELTQLESIWQTLDPTNPRIVADNAPVISAYLVSIFQHWQKAQALDHHKRLAKKLAWLGVRIEGYRQAWRERHMKTFGSTYTTSV